MRKFVILGAMVAVFILAVVVRVKMIAAEAAETKEGVETIQRREGYPVDVVPVRQGAFEVWREVHGLLMGYRESHIRTADPARIKSIDCKIGDLVKADVTLIRLDPDDPKNLTRVNLAKKVYDEAKSDYEKYRRLADKDFMPKNNADKARLQMEAAKSDYELARTGVELSSSIDGVVTALSARVGERADKDRDLAVVSAVDPLRFTSQISDTDAAVISTGQAARVRTPEGGEETGEVERVSLRAEPENSMFDLEITVSNPEGALKIGTFATAEVRVVNMEEAMYIDYRCLMTDPDGGLYVYQVKDETAVRKPVKIAASNEDYAAVEAGSLEPELPVVVRGKGLLRDGAKVVVDKTEDRE